MAHRSKKEVSPKPFRDLIPHLPSLKSKDDDEEVIVKSMALLMHETGWSIQTIKSIPLPTYIILAEELSKQAKRIEQQMKAKNR